MRPPFSRGGFARLWSVFLFLSLPVLAQTFDVTATVSGRGMVVGTGTYDSGATATLIPAPQVGWKFDHWTGDVPVGREAETPLVMEVTANTSLQAVFVETEELPEGLLAHGGTVVVWGKNDHGQTNVPPGLTDVVAISAGWDYTVALRGDGTVVAWGYSGAGETNVPADLGRGVQMATGYSHTLVLQEDGSVRGWGLDNDGQATAPAFPGPVRAVVPGEYHSFVLLTNGTVVGWGSCAGAPAAATNIVHLASGNFHGLALREDGKVLSWLWNSDYGQANVPTDLREVVQLAGGYFHSLAVQVDGTVRAWGKNDLGQTNVPVGLTDVVQVATRFDHNVALRADGTVVAWGLNDAGQTDVPLGLANVIAVAAGRHHSAAVIGVARAERRTRVREVGESTMLSSPFASARSYQWYRDSVALAGETQNTLSLASVSLADAGAYQVLADWETDAWLSAPTDLLVYERQVSGQGSITVSTNDTPGHLKFHAVAAPGWKLDHWESDLSGTELRKTAQLGGTNAYSVLAHAVFTEAGQVTVTTSFAGQGLVLGGGSCDERSEVRLMAAPEVGWKFDHWTGDVPAGRETENPLVIEVFASTSLHAVFVEAEDPEEGQLNLSWLGATGSIVSWGYNGVGQTNVPVGLTNVTMIAGGVQGAALLDDDTVAVWGTSAYGQTNAPAGLTNIIQVTCGEGYHTVALRADGTVLAWGGIGFDNGQTTVPAGLSNVIAVADGGYHTLALKADGTVVGWGRNDMGQINIPAGLSNVVAIAGGCFHSMALRADGTVVVWGDNTYGQTNVLAELSNVVGIGGGTYHCAALRDDGTVVAWGANNYGQTSVPADLAEVIHIAVGQYLNLALRKDGTVRAWGINLQGQLNVPTGLSNLVAIATDGNYHLGLRVGGGSDGGSLASPESAELFAEIGSQVHLGLRFGYAATYQWYRDGVPLQGANQPTLRYDTVGLADAGRHQLLVVGQADARLSLPRDLLVYERQVEGEGNLSVTTTEISGQLLFQAVASPGWKLDHWEGDLSGTELRKTAQLGGTNAYSVLARAVFVEASQVTVTTSFEGHGLVLGGGSYDERMEVRLMAAPEVGWKFDHWTGDVPAGMETENPLVIEVPGATSLRAVFVETGEVVEGLYTAGTVVAWGRNDDGECNVPAGLDDVMAISTSYTRHNLALRRDGTVVAWGSRALGACDVPPDLAEVVSIAAGGHYSVVIEKGGRVRAWGRGDYGQCNVPADLTNAVSLVGGYFHSFGIRSDGSVAGWGYNVSDVCNIPSTYTSPYSAGVYFTLAVKPDGRVAVWGDISGALLQPPSDLVDVVALSGGYTHSLGLRADGQVFAWGQNDNGQCDVPPNLGSVVAISAGGHHSLALRADGTVVAWGSNAAGQSTVPDGLRNVIAISAGEQHSLALVGASLLDPQSIVAEEGETVVLPGRFSGAKSYQWYRNGEPITAATQSRFTVEPVALADAGSYQLLAVWETNAWLSAPTELIVKPVGTPRIFADGERVFSPVIRGDTCAVTMTTTFTNGYIFYTTDGSAPGFGSTPYTGPVTIEETTTFRAVAWSWDYSQSAEEAPVMVRIVPTYAVAATVQGQGSVLRSPSRERYLADAVVKLTAVPAVGWRFVRWQGDLNGAFPEGTLVMDGEKAVTAVFEAIPTFALTSVVAGGGRIDGNTGSPYYQGTSVTLTAVASNGWMFLGWQGDVAATNGNEATVILDDDRMVEAVFGTTLSTTVNGIGQIELSPATGPYPYGSVVHATPVPGEGQQLTVWGGDALGKPLTAFDLVVTKANPLMVARFDPLAAGSFTVTTLASAGGKVVANPAQGSYASNTVVSLMAVPDPGYAFLEWSEDRVGTENPLSVTVTSNLVVKAQFASTVQDPVRLTVQADHGQVTRTPDAPLYERGTVVTLKAQPSTGYAFTGWTGAMVSGASTISLVLNDDLVVTAVFKPLYQLVAEAQGQGRVVVTPSEGPYVAGTEVTVTAEPNANYGFLRWQGDASGASQQITVTMTNNLRVIAEFAELGTLVTEVKEGQGTIRRTPDQGQYLPGTEVQLEAVPADGYRFVRWEGSISSVNPVASVVVDRAATVWAVFRSTLLATPVVQFGSANYEVFENAGMVTLAVWKTAGSSNATVNFLTINGTARAVEAGQGDYQAVSGSLSFTEEETSAALQIPLVDDNVYEGDQSFTVSLSAAGAGTTLGDPSVATILIRDNDPPTSTNSLAEVRYPSPAPTERGSLQVTLDPAAAGGKWRFLWETAWRASGTVAESLVPGNYVVEYCPVPGYFQPGLTTNAVVAGLLQSVTSEYVATLTPQFGALRVVLAPGGIGAQWRFQGESTWRNSGELVEGLAAGPHVVEFEAVEGYVTPSTRMALVAPEQENRLAATYLLDVPWSAVSPTPLPSFGTIGTELGNRLPYAFNGQLLSDVGYGSGFVVKRRVVLTAAHVLFNDATFEYAGRVWWFFERHRGQYEPLPQTPRGWYIFEGYAAQRELENTPGTSTVASYDLDVAALYFLEDAGRGGYGGYLMSDTTHDWVGGSLPKLLVGYPIAGAGVNSGVMHTVPPISYAFSPLNNRVYATTEIRSYPGASGGPLCVRYSDGWYYPAGIYLGGANQSVVRAIDLDAVDLINRAEVAANAGDNNVGGGVGWVPGSGGGSLFAPGYLQVVLGPPEALAAGAGWRLLGSGQTNYVHDNTAKFGLLPATYTVEFRPAAGFVTPTNRPATIMVEQTTTLHVDYTPAEVTEVRIGVLTFTSGSGLAFEVTAAPSARCVVEAATNLSQPVWELVSTNTAGTDGRLSYSDTQGLIRPARYYRLRQLE